MTNLEEEFQELMRAGFDELRNRYYYRDISRDEAQQLQKMLEEKLGISDPHGELPEEGWQRSSWCVNG